MSGQQYPDHIVVTGGPDLMIWPFVSSGKKDGPRSWIGELHNGQLVKVVGECECRMRGFSHWLEIETEIDQKKTTGFVAKIYLRPVEGK